MQPAWTLLSFRTLNINFVLGPVVTSTCLRIILERIFYFYLFSAGILEVQITYFV